MTDTPDKAMDEVMREHKIHCGLCKHPVSCIDCVDKKMRVACRAYAEKVLEGLVENKYGYAYKDSKIADNAMLKLRELRGE